MGEDKMLSCRVRRNKRWYKRWHHWYPECSGKWLLFTQVSGCLCESQVWCCLLRLSASYVCELSRRSSSSLLDPVNIALSKPKGRWEKKHKRERKKGKSRNSMRHSFRILISSSSSSCLAVAEVCYSHVTMNKQVKMNLLPPPLKVDEGYVFTPVCYLQNLKIS